MDLHQFYTELCLPLLRPRLTDTEQTSSKTLFMLSPHKRGRSTGRGDASFTLHILQVRPFVPGRSAMSKRMQMVIKNFIFILERKERQTQRHICDIFSRFEYL